MIRTRRHITLTLSLAAALLAAGCSSLFKEPEVRLDGLRMAGVGLRGATLVARVHITNPNGFDLATRALTYDLELQDTENEGAWVRLAQGTVAESIEVDSNGSTVVEVPIEFRYSDLGPAVRSLLDRGTFGYRVSGQVELQEPVSRTVPYRKTGRVAMDARQ